ncbi:MAG: hypothetical protein ACJAU0_000380 [Flavobacteriales bacterium]|jgi:hypothetical protein
MSYNSEEESYSSVDLNSGNECLIPYCTIKQPKITTIMKKLIAILLVSLPLFTLANSFSSKMSQAMSKYESAQSVKEFVLASNLFGQISQAHSDQWEPAYYESFCLVTAGFDAVEFGEKEGYLNRAEVQIDLMLKKWEGNAEIWTLKALYYSATLMLDMRRAASISPQIEACTQQALGISPANPRAKCLKIRNNMGIAQYTGGDLAPICADAAEVLSTFGDFKIQTEWSPTWGETLLESITANCK